jgi:hypothetical protein
MVMCSIVVFWMVMLSGLWHVVHVSDVSEEPRASLYVVRTRVIVSTYE